MATAHPSGACFTEHFVSVESVRGTGPENPGGGRWVGAGRQDVALSSVEPGP